MSFLHDTTAHGMFVDVLLQTPALHSTSHWLLATTTY